MEEEVCLVPSLERLHSQLNNSTGTMEKPLKGVVLCCTSISPEQRVSSSRTITAETMV